MILLLVIRNAVLPNFRELLMLKIIVTVDSILFEVIIKKLHI